MNLTLTAALFLSFLCQGIGQNLPALRFDKPKTTLDGANLMHLYNNLTKNLDKKVVFLSASPVTLHINAELIDKKTIIGMDEVTFCEIKFFFELVASDIQVYRFERSVSGKGQDSKNAVNTCIKNFEKEHLVTLEDGILETLHKIYIKDCASFINFSFQENTALEERILFYESFPSISSCYTLAQIKASEIRNERCVKFCEEDLLKIETAIEAGHSPQFKKSVSDLVNADTRCSCYTEVIRLAKRVREIKTKEMESQSIPKYLQDLKALLDRH
ncbi:MAG: hypothetical protein KA479_09275 [Saprospiraceae bacterium]|nr:hypothetical protein [Saprospiraceae bacterium]